MSENNLSLKAREAMRHIRNKIMHTGKFPSVRDLMDAMSYKSPRSAMLLFQELEENGFLEKKSDGGYRFLKDLENSNAVRTVSIPLVGTVTCGVPILAQENIEAMIPVATNLAKPGSKYFLLRAKGNSMNEAGINDGDLILAKQQNYAENGQRVIALIDDEATVKEYYNSGDVVRLMPRSTDKAHQQIIVTHDFQIQGIVVAAIPQENNKS